MRLENGKELKYSLNRAIIHAMAPHSYRLLTNAGDSPARSERHGKIEWIQSARSDVGFAESQWAVQRLSKQ